MRGNFLFQGGVQQRVYAVVKKGGDLCHKENRIEENEENRYTPLFREKWIVIILPYDCKNLTMVL